MASISTDKIGLRTIQFIAGDGKRRSIRLGKVAMKVADEVCRRIELLNTSAIAGCSMDGDTAQWLAKIGDDLHGKLVAVRLADARHRANVPALGAFLQTWLDKRATAKPNSVKNYKMAAAKLTEFFGDAVALDAITPGRAEDFALAMAEKHAKEWTWRLVKFARQFFHSAVRDKIIVENPFAGIKPPTQATVSRQFFVTPSMAAKVLDACPDSEWRLIFALSRFGGLRCPSEHLALTWDGVDWARDRFLVHAPKTEHHDDGGERWVPIFPELRPFLAEAFELAEPGTIHVVAKHRGANSNLRTHLERIIRKAGLKPWPKLFVNLRASRETELAETYPMHVVCAWIGNSERVAAKHYLQVTEAHFQSAAQSGAVALRNPVQQPAATVRKETQELTEAVGVARDCEPVRLDANYCSIGNYTRQESNL